MQPTDNQTTHNLLEDQWSVVLNAYEDEPDLAFILAQNFQVMKDVLETGPSGAKQVIESFEEAIETLFPFSEHYEAGREFFLLAVKGTLRPAFDLTKVAEQARSEADRDEN
jgi:hypothetical protein